MGSTLNVAFRNGSVSDGQNPVHAMGDRPLDSRVDYGACPGFSLSVSARLRRNSDAYLCTNLSVSNC